MLVFFYFFLCTFPQTTHMTIWREYPHNKNKINRAGNSDEWHTQNCHLKGISRAGNSEGNRSFNCQMQLIFIQFSSSENVNFSPLPTAKKVNCSYFKRVWHLALPNLLLNQILSLYRVHQKSLNYHIHFSFILILGQRNSIHLTEWDPDDHGYR